MSGARISVHELLTHRRWIDALARHLVHGDADDSVQEVWIQAIRAAPTGGGNERSWLAKVLLNTIRNRIRTDTRRSRREDSWGLEHAQVPTPEETSIRAEMQRRLATLVCELPEALRHVIYLRYVDEHQPTEIAKMLGIPAGTVRWRLKDAVDRLRTRLDEQESGGRAAWSGLLTPSAATPRTAPIDRGRWLVTLGSRGPVVGLIVAAAATLFAIGAWKGLAGHPLDSVDQHKPLSAIPAPPHRHGGLPIFTLSAREESECLEVKPVQDLLNNLKRDLDAWRSPDDLFKESQANQPLQAHVAPLVAQAFRRAAQGCSHSFSCRGQVCNVEFSTQHGLSPESCFPDTGMEFSERLSSGFSNIVDSGTPQFDLLSKQGFTTMHQYWRFEASDASRVAHSQRRPLYIPPTAFSAALPTLPVGISPDCERRWKELRERVQSLRLQVASFDPARTWEASKDDPVVRERVLKWASSILKRPVPALPFSVACHGRVCALTQTVSDDVMSVTWSCRPPDEMGKTVCMANASNQSWYQVLERADPNAARLRPSHQEHDASTRPPIFLVVNREESRTFATWQCVLELWDSFDWRSELRSCDDQGVSKGRLAGLLKLPDKSQDAELRKHFSVHIGGDAAATKAGVCVARLLENTVQRHHVGQSPPGLSLYFDIDLPLDLSKLESKLERLRKSVTDELSTPAL